MPRAGQGRYGSEAELAIQARGVNQRGRAPATRHHWVSGRRGHKPVSRRRREPFLFAGVRRVVWL